MSKNIYTHDIFFQIKNDNNYTIEDELKSVLDNIYKIIDNNYGITYHEKNNKHYKKGKNNHGNKSKNNNYDDDKWRLTKKTTIKKEINNELDKYNYEINSLLNKLSPKNFESISKKIMVYYEKSLSQEDLTNLLVSFINSIFSKAVMQPIYCPYYVKFLNILEEKYTILYLIDEKCNDYREIFNKSEEVDTEMTKQEEYDQFCKDNLEKVFKSGYSQFLGELFNNKMINIDIIKSNIDFFIQSLNNSIKNTELFENTIICISQLIKTTSTEFKAINYKYNELHNILIGIHDSYNESRRIKYKLLDLCEFVGKLL
jgi:hypothetical protein